MQGRMAGRRHNSQGRFVPGTDAVATHVTGGITGDKQIMIRHLAGVADFEVA